MSKKTITLAFIRWFDSSIIADTVYSPDDVAGMLDNESAGILVKEDKESITIALDHCPKTGGFRCTLCIPKINVKSIKRIKIPSKG